MTTLRQRVVGEWGRKLRRELKLSQERLREQLDEIREEGPRVCRSARCEWGSPLSFDHPYIYQCPLPVCNPIRGDPVWRVDTAMMILAEREGVELG